jgi:DNA polymerase (family 10)
MTRNAQIAAALREIASLLGTSPEPNAAFKIRAYLRAAKVIEELPKDIAEYGDGKALQELPGIGKAIAEKIMEFQRTGSIAAIEKLRRSQDGIAPELLRVENLGPKRALQIQSELGITTIAGLIDAAKQGKLQKLPRMSELMEKKILESALHATERNTRFPRAAVESDVEGLLHAIRAVPGVDRAEAAGSYRRKKETVGDIDILTVTKSPADVSSAIAALPFVRNVVAHGDKKLSFDLQSGLRVDVRFVGKDQWGSALLYFTGSKENNIFMRQVAIRKGWKLSEYGLFDGEGNVIASKEEMDVYKALELPYREAWERNER